MGAGDTARSNYESARSEIVQRIALRDNAVLFYLGAVGTIIGVSLGRSQPEILLVIPYVALGVGLIVCQHNTVIGNLGYFCVAEVEPFLRALKEPEEAPQWDDSYSLWRSQKGSIWARTAANVVLLIVPSLGGIVWNWQRACDLSSPVSFLWYLGLLCTAMSFFFLVRAHKSRIKLYGDPNWCWKKSLPTAFPCDAGRAHVPATSDQGRPDRSACRPGE